MADRSQELVLPDEIWLDIFSYVVIDDIIRMRRTCYRFLSLTKERKLWMKLMLRVYIEHQLPLSSAFLQSQTAAEIEHQAVHHCRYRSKLIRGTARLSPSRSQYGPGGPNKHLLVPGGRWLLTVSDNNMFCWDLSNSGGEAPEVVCSYPAENGIAERMFSELHDSGIGATLVVSKHDSLLRPTCDIFSAIFIREKPQVTHLGSFSIGKTFSSVITSGSFAIGMPSEHWERERVVLFEWEKVLTGGTFRCGHAILARPEDQGNEQWARVRCLLPDLRIVAGSVESILVFGPPPLQETNTLEPLQGPLVHLEVLWRFSPYESRVYTDPIDISQLSSTPRYLGSYGMHRDPFTLFQLIQCGQDYKVLKTQVHGISLWKTGYLSGITVLNIWNSPKWTLRIFTRPHYDTNRSPMGGVVSFSSFEIDRCFAELSPDTYVFDELSGRLLLVGPSTREGEFQVYVLELE